MKKSAGAGLLIATLLTGSIGWATNVMASNLGTVEQLHIQTVQAAQRVEASRYIKFSGIVTEVKQTDQSLTFIVKNPENDMQMVFPVSHGVLMFSNSTTEKLEYQALQRGVNIEVYYDKHKPVPLIYPATAAPEIILVRDKEIGEVKVSKFDEQFLSLDQELKLNLSQDTILLNEQGEPIKKDDLQGKELIVFYTFTTKSIPAQTSPKKIIALDDQAERPIEVEQLIGEDHYVKEGMRMIPLRKIAEHAGYNVEWDPSSQIVTLRKQNQSFTISISEKAYGFNRSLRYFEVAPEIINGKTYVQDEILTMLIVK
ncbi:copper amine oxidase N-terminal domain-containing protein [Ammoniphilus sp. YIM 78166]|uniref:copper amine oxidase N-terminal domain-containing protein n=1 Tax=Ammoniphilus sp. YIM 78166 TaxID=1644106 RepID=UPI001432268B|nr:copper amine oxidase N-terminal domain-containing protein [Ammoniphilus sp. YIM 78166]